MIYLFVNVFLLFISPLKKQRDITVIVAIVLLLFLGLGYANGTDWIGYFANYESLHNDQCNGCESNFEIGYNFIAITFGYFGFFSVVLICAIFNIFSIIKFATLFKYPYFVIFCIFSMYGWFLYVEQIRQAIAISIILFGIPSLYQKRIFPYIFCVLLACLFHSSAVFALIFLVPTLNHKIIVPFFIAIILSLSIFIFIFSVDVINIILSLAPPGSIIFSKLLFYSTSDNYSPKFSIGVGLLGDIIFLIIFFALGLRRQKTYEDDLSFFGAFIFLFILIAGKFQGVFLRFAYYAFPFVIIYLYIIMGRFKDSFFIKKKSFKVVKFLVFIYFASMIVRPFITHPVVAYDVVNYKSAFFYIQDLDDRHYAVEREKKRRIVDNLGFGYLLGY